VAVLSIAVVLLVPLVPFTLVVFVAGVDQVFVSAEVLVLVLLLLFVVLVFELVLPVEV
jgi:hypothetical protein